MGGLLLSAAGSFVGVRKLHRELQTMRDTLQMAEKEYQRKISRLQQDFEERVRQVEMSASVLAVAGGGGATSSSSSANVASLEEIVNLET